MTLEILKHDHDKSINFQGMLVGNPFVDPFSNTLTQIRSFYSHGLLAKPLFDEWSEKCTSPDNYDSHSCESMEYDMFKGLYGKINPYALDYPICIEENEKHKHKQKHHHRKSSQLSTDPSSQAKKLLNYSTAGGPPFLPTEDVYRPCSDLHLATYLNRPDVQQAIHVSPQVSTRKWYDCSDIVDYDPNDFDASII